MNTQTSSPCLDSKQTPRLKFAGNKRVAAQVRRPLAVQKRTGPKRQARHLSAKRQPLQELPLRFIEPNSSSSAETSYIELDDAEAAYENDQPSWAPGVHFAHPRAGNELYLTGQWYSKDKKLGEGAYGAVHRFIGDDSHSMLAVKTIKLSSTGESGLHALALKEVVAWKALPHHDNLIMLKHVTMDNTGVRMMMECLECNLKEHLQQQHGRYLSMPIIKDFMRQILQGVHLLHKNQCIHRDLKPENIVLDGTRTKLKLADFGLLSSTEEDRSSLQVITANFRPPELVLRKHFDVQGITYGPEVDMWSVGCILAEMINGNRLLPLKSENTLHILDEMVTALGPPSLQEFEMLGHACTQRPDAHELFSRLARRPTTSLQTVVPRLRNDVAGLDLLSRLLCYQSDERISCEQAMCHPWLIG